MNNIKQDKKRQHRRTSDFKNKPIYFTFFAKERLSVPNLDFFNILD